MVNLRTRWSLAISCAILSSAAASFATFAAINHVRDRASIVNLGRQMRGLFLDGRTERLIAVTLDCWGDSLTEGFGVPVGSAFPTLLDRNYGRPAANHGVAGDRSGDVRRRFLARVKPSHPERAVIWVGRNNGWEPDVVAADIAAIVADLAPGSQYLILGAIAGEGEPDRLDGIRAINARLAATYGRQFVPVGDILQSRANVRFPQDTISVQAGSVPASLRSDRVHLNTAGQATVAYAIETALIANGW